MVLARRGWSIAAGFLVAAAANRPVSAQDYPGARGTPASVSQSYALPRGTDIRPTVVTDGYILTGPTEGGQVLPDVPTGCADGRCTPAAGPSWWDRLRGRRCPSTGPAKGGHADRVDEVPLGAFLSAHG